MANNKKKKLTPIQQEYQQFAKAREPSRTVWKNCFRAFISGGAICAVGQGIQQFFITFADFDKKTASSPTVAVLIFISVLLTGFGVYDKFAQWAGAGSAVPVTGFANSMASAAIEHRSEGLVLGAAAKMFKLAGAVIVFGTVTAFIVGIVHAIINPGSVGGGS
ncbi:MAG TPA: stage V sporulation protein AC [Bacilli bacterium]